MSRAWKPSRGLGRGLLTFMLFSSMGLALWPKSWPVFWLFLFLFVASLIVLSSSYVLMRRKFRRSMTAPPDETKSWSPRQEKPLSAEERAHREQQAREDVAREAAFRREQQTRIDAFAERCRSGICPACGALLNPLGTGTSCLPQYLGSPRGKRSS